jgi:hypothetical protein
MHWSSATDMKFLVTQSSTAFIFLIHSSALHNFPDITSKFRTNIMFAVFHAVFVCLLLIIFYMSSFRLSADSFFYVMKAVPAEACMLRIRYTDQQTSVALGLQVCLF